MFLLKDEVANGKAEKTLNGADTTNKIEDLSPREKEIVTLRFGLFGSKEYTQKQVADRLGISQSYISRLEKKIILKLKDDITSNSGA